jgi:hypothetical protein
MLVRIFGTLTQLFNDSRLLFELPDFSCPLDGGLIDVALDPLLLKRVSTYFVVM